MTKKTAPNLSEWAKSKISKQDKKALRDKAKQLGASESYIVRCALAQYLKKRSAR